MSNTSFTKPSRLGTKDAIESAVQKQQRKSFELRAAKHLCLAVNIDPYGQELVGKLGDSSYQRNVHIAKQWIAASCSADDQPQNLKSLSSRFRKFLVTIWEEDF